MTSILIVAGTRPEIIKLAPVVLAARERYAARAAVSLCVTGQHQTMAREALAIFGIEPDASLDIMKPGQTLNDIAMAVFERLPRVIAGRRPDALIVQGDTTTAAMAALCAFNVKVPIAHVEAGLRSFSMTAPYPEECNRRVISVMSSFNFCPTEDGAGNLRREGTDDSTIHVTGNTVVDAIERIKSTNSLAGLGEVHPALRAPFVLVTAHRRESFGQGFADLCAAIRECAERFPGTQFVYPVHLNPNVQRPVHDVLGGLANVFLVPPVSYLSLLTLMKHCAFVLTDSGGIQEEAPSFGKFAVVMRDVTERMESVRMGISELVGTDRAKITAAVTRELSQPTPVPSGANPYGDGKAAERILNVLTA